MTRIETTTGQGNQKEEYITSGGAFEDVCRVIGKSGLLTVIDDLRNEYPDKFGDLVYTFMPITRRVGTQRFETALLVHLDWDRGRRWGEEVMSGRMTNIKVSPDGAMKFGAGFPSLNAGSILGRTVLGEEEWSNPENIKAAFMKMSKHTTWLKRIAPQELRGRNTLRP